MKLSKFFMRPILIAISAAAALQTSAFVYENLFELTERGDFDGDGLLDMVIVDRATGAFRVGYQTGAGTYNWADPRASGMENVDALSVGKLFQTTRDGLAVASIEGNRVNLFDVPTATTAAIPTSVFVPGIGPNVVIAIDLPGAGNTAHADLMIGSSQNSPPNAGRLSLVRNNAGTTSLLVDGTAPALNSGNRLFLKKTGAELAGAMVAAGATDEFRVFAPSSTTANQIIAVTGILRGSRFISGNFSGALFNHTVFYRPGQSNFTSHLSSEPTAGTFAIGAGVSFPLSKAISQLITLPGPTADRLLALFDDGSGAVYNFNGSAVPTLIQNITPDAGERITGALPSNSSNDFMVFSGAGNTSANTRPYKVSGAGYAVGLKSSLPALTPLSGDANIFLFQQEPFVSSVPGLLRSLNAGDWTSDFAIVPGSPNTFSANLWNFEGGSLGLRNPVSNNFGPIAPGSFFGLPNQYAASISLFSRAPAVGNEIVEIKINPLPGEFKTTIDVTLSSPLVGAQLFYRLNATDAWTIYSSPIRLFKTTTIQYYGNPLGSSNKSRIHTAAYVFPIDPSLQDSDRDGVPDFVEIAKGLNPNGGKDQDGDGFTDLNELVAGSNPLNTNSIPAFRLEEKSAFDLKLGLQPLNGLTGAPTNAALGVGVRSYDLFGNLYRANVSSNLAVATVTDPAVWHTNILQTTDPGLIVAATDPHFDINVPGTNTTLGRELIGIIPAPRPAFPEVTYHYGGGALATEAAGWLTAAQTLFSSLPHETVKANLDIYDSLTAFLFERKVSQILLARGDLSGSNMTLFPFRPTDSGRTNPPSASLKLIEKQLDDARKGFKLVSVFTGLETMVATATPAGMNQLKSLTSEIYRISSASNNAAPAKYPSPIDVLRGFLETGLLQSNYLSALTAPVNLTTAFNAAATALSNVVARPIVNLDLIVRSDTFGGSCTRLDTASLPAVQKSLVHPGGNQYRLLESFNLLPGSHVHVTGYSDATNPTCPGDQAIEVISIALDTVPEPTVVDTDGDLLLDNLEFLLFGSLSNTGLGDADGDGYSNLQEFLDGTDPLDPSAHGLAIVNLAPPAVTIAMLPGGEILLTFDWPAAYADDIHFSVKSTTTLGTAFATEPIAPIHTSGNHFEVHLPNPGAAHKFYLLSLSAI